MAMAQFGGTIRKNDTPPHLIEFMYSDTIEISHLTLSNSAFWTVHPVYSKEFLAHHLWIINPSNVSNTDGIDPDSTHDVLIHDVYIDVGDDGIAIKSGWNEYGYQLNHSSMNITIRDCSITTPCAAVSIGSEMSGGVKMCTFQIAVYSIRQPAYILSLAEAEGGTFTMC